MQDAFGIIIFVVVGVAAVGAVVSLVLGKGSYDQIGRGGLSIGEDRDLAPRRMAAVPVNPRERDAEIRQMLTARNARREARGEAPVDVEAELASLTRPAVAVDGELRAEIRSLVQARNSRLMARGREPLDVEAEVERRLRDLAG